MFLWTNGTFAYHVSLTSIDYPSRGHLEKIFKNGAQIKKVWETLGQGYYAVAHHGILLRRSSNHQSHVPTPSCSSLGQQNLLQPTVGSNCNMDVASAKPERGHIERIQPTAPIISGEKLLLFQLKWVIYMSKNIFYMIKTWALISDSSFYNVELLTFLTGVNNRCQSNMSSIKRLFHHIRGKIF